MKFFERVKTEQEDLFGRIETWKELTPFHLREMKFRYFMAGMIVTFFIFMIWGSFLNG